MGHFGQGPWLVAVLDDKNEYEAEHNSRTEGCVKYEFSMKTTRKKSANLPGQPEGVEAEKSAVVGKSPEPETKREAEPEGAPKEPMVELESPELEMGMEMDMEIEM